MTTKLDVAHILDTAAAPVAGDPALPDLASLLPTVPTQPSQAVLDLWHAVAPPDPFPTMPTLPSQTAHDLWDQVTHPAALPTALTAPANLSDPLASALSHLDATLADGGFTLPSISSSHDFMFQ